MNNNEYTRAIAGLKGTTLLIGFYGGGNFGDELLYDVFSDMFKSRRKPFRFLFQSPRMFSVWHNDADRANMVDARSKSAIVKSLITQRNYVFGGGGLWGRDFNTTLLLFTILLFIFSLLPGKRLYLFGVGFYDSAGKAAKFSAWLMAKRTRLIIARDPQSHDNFSAYTSRVAQDQDAAFYMDSCTWANASYQNVIGESNKKKLLVFLRGRYSAKNQHIVEDVLRRFSGEFEIVFYVYGPSDVRAKLMEQLKITGATIRDFDHKTTDLFLSMKFYKHKQNLYVIAPQYHVQLAAHLAGIDFLPVSYDHKTAMLHRQLHISNAVDYWGESYMSSAAEWVGAR